MSQNDIILNHLQKKGSITTFEAYNRYHITRLPARIHELRKSHRITKTVHSTHRSNGVVGQYCRYYLKGEL